MLKTIKKGVMRKNIKQNLHFSTCNIDKLDYIVGNQYPRPHKTPQNSTNVIES